MTHSEASDLLVGVPSLLFLVWLLWPHPPAHQTDPWSWQDVDAHVTMKSNERMPDWYVAKARSSMAERMNQWTEYRLSVEERRGSALFEDTFDDAAKGHKTRNSPNSLKYEQLW
jgi:hypothetical protein